MDENKLIVTIKPGICPPCSLLRPRGRADDVYPRATVTSAKIVDESWVAQGHIEIEGSHCPLCANTLRAIERAIPIQCEGFSCPVCHTAEHLTFDVTNVDHNELVFTATIGCTTCKKKRKLSKMLKELFSMLTIKVGPLGLPVKECLTI